ncbi:hypothetical protein NFI96_027931 [Prochilodus magdalenae]|nr:hypothetical protein NFI96_027931 [Prochilodus magdalenae]
MIKLTLVECADTSHLARIVSAFTFSWKKQRDKAITQEVHYLPQHKLVTASSTRWGGRQRIIGRALQQHRATSQVQIRRPGTWFVLGSTWM